MTDAQLEMWLAAQLSPAAANAFIQTYILEVVGPLDLPAFRRTVQIVINRHEALRSSIHSSGDGMAVAPQVEVEVEVLESMGEAVPGAGDASGLPAEDELSFDLMKAPLIRLRVIRFGDKRHRILISLHTLICDRWSFAVLVRELAAVYSALRAGPDLDLPAPPSDDESVPKPASSALENEESLAYWRQRFSEAPPELELPTDRPRTARRSFAGSTVRVPLGEELTGAIRSAAARSEDASQNWLFATFLALLHRLTGQSDVVVGMPWPARERASDPEFVGQSADFLAIRGQIEPERSFQELLGDLGRAVRDAVEHRPFNYFRFRFLERDLGGGRLPPLAATFSIEPALDGITFGTATTRIERAPRRFALFDIEATVRDDGSNYELELVHDTAHYDRATVARWANHYRTLLAAAVVDPSTPIARLPLLQPDEFRQVTETFNDTAGDYPRDRCVPQLIEDSASRVPGKTAVESGGQRLTYAELDARANQLSRHLRELGVRPDTPVGLCVRRSVDMVVAALGIWKAGGAYVPLDPDFPSSRLKLYLEDSGAPVVVTQSDLKDRLPAGRTRTVDLEADRAVIEAHSTEPIDALNSSAHLAYVIYTSGSTGTPNGVPVEHRALVNFLVSMQRRPGLASEDVVAAVTTISFDIHHLEFWLPLIAGARVAVIPREIAGDGVRLGEELDRIGATLFQATPATWRLLTAAGWAGRPGMKALCGGEPMPPEHTVLLGGKVGELWNMYGPTETTVWSTIHRVDELSGPIPIGRPIANTSVYILDRLRQPVPIGCVGEIYIGGEGLARGYWNRPELTASRFLDNPFRPGERMYKTGDLGRLRSDGVIECQGRIDHQVKVSGHRIELGEIESALAKHPDVAAAAARVWGQPPQLAAYVVARPGQPRSAESVKHFLRDRLPGYMVPALMTFVDALPLTPNGKVDRRALPDPVPAPDESRTTIPPRTDAERAVLEIWNEVFGRTEFGVADDFFDLGGTSLQAGEIVALLNRRLGHAVPLGAMYEATTVEKLAVLIQSRLETASTASLVPLQVGGRRPPLFIIAGIGGHVFTLHKFARLLGPDYQTYGLKAVGVDGDRPPPESFEEIAAEYVREITAACPAGPYLVSGYSIGAHVAMEVALQLEALGHDVPLLVIFDMPAPGYPPPLSVPRRLVLHLNNLFRRDGGFRYLIRRFRNLGNRVIRRLGLERMLFPAHPSLNALPQESLRDVWVTMQRAARKYRPRGRLKGLIALYRSEIPLDLWNAVVHTDPELGWGERTTGLIEVRTVPHGHLEMFHDDNIGNLARQVAGAVDRIAAGAESPRHSQAVAGSSHPAAEREPVLARG